MNLIESNDCKAFLHYLGKKPQQLVCIGSESIEFGSNGAKEFLILHCNIEPNTGEELDNQEKKSKIQALCLV